MTLSLQGRLKVKISQTLAFLTYFYDKLERSFHSVVIIVSIEIVAEKIFMKYVLRVMIRKVKTNSEE